MRVLVATDIAARGIDVPTIELVVNFDLPDQLDDYVHRISRTSRAGREGKAISFAAPEQKKDVAQIQKLINMTLTIKSPSGENSIQLSLPHRCSVKDEDGRAQVLSDLVAAGVAEADYDANHIDEDHHKKLPIITALDHAA